MWMGIYILFCFVLIIAASVHGYAYGGKAGETQFESEIKREGE